VVGRYCPTYEALGRAAVTAMLRRAKIHNSPRKALARSAGANATSSAYVSSLVEHLLKPGPGVTQERVAGKCCTQQRQSS